MKKEPTKTQHALFQKHDRFNESDYRELCEYTHAKGMDFTSTPFDYASADYLEKMVDFYKISSSDLSNIPFIQHIGAKGKPVYISVGAAYLSEVDEAVRTLKNSGCQRHCPFPLCIIISDKTIRCESESYSNIKKKIFLMSGLDFVIMLLQTIP